LVDGHFNLVTRDRSLSALSIQADVPKK